MILEYLNTHAQKAYREIVEIISSPSFLFSNDPALLNMEAKHNYVYIHGFNRLIKNNRISIEKLVEVFAFLENEIEHYLKQHYIGKGFIFYVQADALVPAFTIILVSYYEGMAVKVGTALTELIQWYQENACFNGVEIREENTEDEDSEAELVETFPDSKRTYIKTINT